MTAIPRLSGTVTFLFTDIEGSTRRWQADPDAMRAELAAHDEVPWAAIEVHGLFSGGRPAHSCLVDDLDGVTARS